MPFEWAIDLFSQEGSATYYGYFKRATILLDDHSDLLKRPPAPCFTVLFPIKQTSLRFCFSLLETLVQLPSSPLHGQPKTSGESGVEKARVQLCFYHPYHLQKSTSSSVIGRGKNDSLTATYTDYINTYTHTPIYIYTYIYSYRYCRSQPCRQHPSLKQDRTVFAMTSKSLAKYFAPRMATLILRKLQSTKPGCAEESINSKRRSLRACSRVRSRTPIRQLCRYLNHNTILPLIHSLIVS